MASEILSIIYSFWQVSKGFSNWKDATKAFRKHAQSNTHAEAVVTLPKTTADVGESLSAIHKQEKEQARYMLYKIISSIRYLARQGLALRGGGNDANSNLIQLLRLRAEDIPQLLKWLDKQSKKHTAHENQNEILEIMAHRVLREILDDVSKSPFLAVMVDETTDQSNIEQLTLVIRCVDDDFCVSEEFLGL